MILGFWTPFSTFKTNSVAFAKRASVELEVSHMKGGR